jgi:hypothetical protein
MRAWSAVPTAAFALLAVAGPGSLVVPLKTTP